jgi:4-amino-4-deoxy-L-arabinose transferase-like glycosyltransferase
VDRLHQVLLGLVVLGAALLRLRYLDEPMRWDEAATFQKYAMGTVGTITSTYDRPNNQILYSLLTHFSLKAFGEAVWVVRCVAFAAGVALVPVAYLTARRLYDPVAGLWAAALTATFAPLIDYSVNGRGYTLGALFVLLALWLGAGLLERPRLRTWAAFVATSTLAVYTLPTMAIGVSAVAVWMACAALLRRPRKPQITLQLALALAVTAGLSLLLYSAVLGQHGWDSVTPTAREWGPVRDLASAVWENWNRTAPHPLDWLVAAGFVASLVVHKRIARHPVPIALAALVTLVGVVLVAPIAPFTRSWLFLLPLYLIQAAAGLAWATRRAGRAAALVPIAAAIAFGATMLHDGLRGADVPPVTDNDIVGLLRRYVPAHQSVVIDRYASAPIHYYYFQRFGDHTRETTSINSRERQTGHIVVVVPRGTSPITTVYKAGGTAADSPRLLIRREWIDIYDVPLLRHAQPRRIRSHLPPKA